MTASRPSHEFLHGDYEPKFQGFQDLMPNRIQQILLVATFYDTYILEEDGDLSERIIGEYQTRNLRYPPRIIRVSNAAAALQRLEQDRGINLVVTMMRLPDMDGFEFGRQVKQRFGDLPVVLLAHDHPELEQRLASGDRSGVDFTLVWSGDSRILLAAIKLVEDALNVDHDVHTGNLRVIVLVDDSARYVSFLVPLVFTELMKLTQSLLSEGLNELHRFLRMRARPKLLLARSYEQAIALFQRYRHNLLGVLSDVRFPRDGQQDPEAGFRLAQTLRTAIPDMPFLLMSAEPDNAARARQAKVAFIDKNSANLVHDFNHFIKENLGFGEFCFRLPDGRQVARASNLAELAERIRSVPDESLLYHGGCNHFSNWLMARTEFTLAERIRPKTIADFKNPTEIRNYLVSMIQEVRREKQHGLIADFRPGLFLQEDVFVRFGGGSIGGKARGISFINAMLAQTQLRSRFSGVQISIPRTAVISTDNFEAFLESNRLDNLASADLSDEENDRRFLAGRIPAELEAQLALFLREADFPLAVRSSSLLEDSPDQPLAGLYNTYMLPNNHPDFAVRLRQLTTAVKLVYASTFHRAPRAFLSGSPSMSRNERMAVLIQRLVGRKHGPRYYPSFAGVARSFNFYPVRYMEPEDGIAYVVLGLGRMVVEGGQALGFCPRYPQIVPQLSSPEQAFESTQRMFYALDLSRTEAALGPDDQCNLQSCNLDVAEQDGTLAPVGSVLSLEDNTLRDGLYHQGPRLVSFAALLKWNTFPLAELIEEFLKLGRMAIGRPVEIEFAANLPQQKGQPAEFDLLQIRPMVLGMESEDVRLDDIDPATHICCSQRSLGNGRIEQIRHVVYVPPERFDAGRTIAIADQIGKINAKLSAAGQSCLLIGPGRWGSSDRWLGIPVTWDQISAARVMVECNLPGFQVEPSQGSHFFHNVTAYRIGYLTVGHNTAGEFVDFDWLANQPSVQETAFVRHIELPEPLVVRLDGRQRRGVVARPASLPAMPDRPLPIS